MTDRRPMKRMLRSFMYKHPRRDRGLASVMAMLAPIALVLMVALIPINIGSRASVAAIGTLPVSGTIYSSGGSPVVGADVSVTILNGVTARDTLSTVSTTGGFYTVTFDPGVWDTGNTIFVAASFSSVVGQNSTVADEIGNPFPTIDVHLGTVIPELGTPMTTALTVSVIGIMVVLYARRRGLSPP